MSDGHEFNDMLDVAYRYEPEIYVKMVEAAALRMNKERVQALIEELKLYVNH